LFQQCGYHLDPYGVSPSTQDALKIQRGQIYTVEVEEKDAIIMTNRKRQLDRRRICMKIVYT
jgi:hypothetical protein